MARTVCLGAVVLAAAAVTAASVQAVDSQVTASTPGAAQGPALALQQGGAVSTQRALLDTYCVTCHNARVKAGGLVLAEADVANVANDADLWERVVRKLRAGMMPPPGQRRPDPAAHEAFVGWLESELDQAAAASPNPGRVETFHRLNRFEYKNAIRDLLALDVDVSALLPPDDAGYGFDNMAGVLRLSQSLMERYLSAARKISRLVVGTPPPAPIADTFPVSSDQQQYDRAEGLPFGTRGGILIPRYNFVRDGEYLIRAQFSCALVSAGGCDATAGFDDLHQLEFTVDGDRVALFEMKPTARGRGNGAADPDLPEEEITVDTRWQVRLPVKAGFRDVGVAFLKLPSYETSDYPRLRFIKPSYEGNMVPEGLGIYQPHLRDVTIAGPFEASGSAGDTVSRQRIFVCRPTSAADETACAAKILSTLARRAYRRPVTEGDVEKLMAFYRDEREGGAPFDAGIEMAVRALLVSAEFLFRVESNPGAGGVRAVSTGAVAVQGSNYRISDLELASRLSFFLWSSIPDDELVSLAADGKLGDEATLERQVRRMLADERSIALARNFMPQWLNLRALEFSAPFDPDFDESLRRAMMLETELFFDYIVRQDLSVMDLLTADYTFLNERLAWHYGIRNVKGSHFRKVTLAQDDPRRGLLGHGSILTATSFAIRTSPVKRGKWILESIMGVAPPPPPANVPPLEEESTVGGSGKSLTMRERMAAHRKNPTCAGCHSMIDPVGFALENFDPTGKWRSLDPAMSKIDVTGTLPDGTKFTTLGEFRGALTARPERFASSLAEKLLTYALGRGLESFDMPTVRAITRSASAADYRFSAIVLGIVKSPAFQMRRSLVPSPGAVASLVPGGR
ncbi:MAG: DUF1592 domain-containing protein [Acidimicrobiia bacterium]|nr:DUF1592 domain-containing protein [Acidimicrobiia bacterium]